MVQSHLRELTAGTSGGGGAHGEGGEHGAPRSKEVERVIKKSAGLIKKIVEKNSAQVGAWSRMALRKQVLGRRWVGRAD